MAATIFTLLLTVATLCGGGAAQISQVPALTARTTTTESR